MSQADVTPESIVARIERLPTSRWHAYMRIIISSATFFDGFDAVAIAMVLPSLFAQWHITPIQAGGLVAIGNVGQVIGAIFFGWLAERYGRLRALSWTIWVIAIFSIACGFATNYDTLWYLRFIQGFGLGGEVPIALAYVNEFAKAEQRGRFVLIFQCIFPIGILAVSLVSVWIIPLLGWQWMFFIGALPAVIAAVMRRMLPESPRWLASRGRLADADRVVSEIEAKVQESVPGPLPPPLAAVRVVQAEASWRDLFAGIYLRRTLIIWIGWFAAAFVGYGITIWLPTIYTRVFHLTNHDALIYSSIANAALVAGVLAITFIVDRTGRRWGFTAAFGLAAIPLLILWLMGAQPAVMNVVILTTIASFFIAMMQLSMVLYASELYPTRMRALGSGIGSAWTRMGSIVGPYAVTMTLAATNVAEVFLLFAVVALVGAGTMAFFGVETRGKVLEELSP